MSDLKSKGKVPVANGDLVAGTIADVTGKRYLLASFHGDTNGLATIPVVEAVAKQARNEEASLLFGLDANAYKGPQRDGYLFVEDFFDTFDGLGYGSLFGDPRKNTYITTCNARTHLQPQLNKAV